MIGLHHVQVSCPPEGEDDARRFWRDGLGLTEVPKPPVLAARGGVWFRAVDDAGERTAEVHVGVEPGFAPARKAHPALLVDDPDRVARRLAAAGFEPSWDDAVPGVRRFYVNDPHGNRVEIVSAWGTDDAWA